LILLDGYSIDTFGLIPLQSHIHPINTGIQHKTIKIPGMAGVHDIRTELAPKYFEFEFAIKEQDETTMQAKLNEFVAFLCDDTGRPRDIKLIFDYEPDKYYTVKLNNMIDPERIRGFSRFSVSFVASDPYKYAISPAKVDLVNVIYNRGNCKTTGIITIQITEETDHIKVTLLNTGEFLYIEDDFDTGDIVVVDLEKEHITKNSVSAMPNLYLESDFFEIPVGEFEISVNSGDGVLKFRERWL
jgi:predicted phage tail component-like protein